MRTTTAHAEDTDTEQHGEAGDGEVEEHRVTEQRGDTVDEDGPTDLSDWWFILIAAIVLHPALTPLLKAYGVTSTWGEWTVRITAVCLVSAVVSAVVRGIRLRRRG